MNSNEILVVGDILIDRYKFTDKTLYRLGCSGNIIALLELLNSNYSLLTSHPRPQLIKSLHEKFSAHKDRLTILPTEGEVNFIDYEVSNGITITTNDKPQPSKSINDRDIAKIIKESCATKIIVSDYGLGSIAEFSKKALREKFTKPYVTSFIDARQSNYEDYFGATWFFPTELEFKLFCDKTNIKYNVKEFAQSLSAQGVILKRGDRGLSKYTNGISVDFAPPINSNVVDSFGAGDLLIASMAFSANDRNIHEDSITNSMTILAKKLATHGAGFLNSCHLAEAEYNNIQMKINMSNPSYPVSPF